MTNNIIRNKFYSITSMNHSTGLINNLTPLARILLTYIKELSLESIRIESNEIVNHLCYNIFQSNQVN